ncbi:PREDICTED: allergin-1 isoform X1 [Chinchilla lanigera]|uniref:allergin-1 isoform X1 n=1 Tax=Chinchilla lanigera TaxID=34839 RepID=UPI0006964B92|nr:PREDICTED: allergin-1 isoform X1 [Chinchilla lanigera]
MPADCSPSSPGRMWSRLNKLFFWGVFSSVTFQKAVLDCETMKNTKEFPSPSLNSRTPVITRGQNVSLFCSNENRSLQITYSLFLGQKHVATKKGKGEPVIFNLTISTPGEVGPYKCKAEVFNCPKYSLDFSFRMEEGDSCPACLLLVPMAVSFSVLLAIVLLLVCLMPKCRARKAMRENLHVDPGDTPTEGELYENVCKDQAGCPQEIHYAAPVFQEMAPKEQEACRDGKTGHIYSELTL